MTQSRLDDFLVSDSGGSTDTVTRPALRSSVQTKSLPGSAPSALAIPSGIVTRVEGDPSRTRPIGDLKVPGMDSPITLMGGRLHNYSLLVGLPIGDT